MENMDNDDNQCYQLDYIIKRHIRDRFGWLVLLDLFPGVLR